MAVDWSFESRLERRGATRVCARVYEELDDFMNEFQTSHYWNSDAVGVLSDLRERLKKVLPFDSERTIC